MQIELRALTKTYGSRTVLTIPHASLHFDHTLALIGPSGGGKSTLLRLLAGLIPPSTGNLQIDGISVPSDPEASRRFRADIGIVFQSFNLFPHLTTLQNITLPLTKVHGLAARDATERAFEVLTRFQLADHAAHMPGTLSGGQRQRVAIARAVAIRPRFLLLDEPTSALDPEMTGEVLDLLAELSRENVRSVLVTHEMSFARSSADQVAFLANGALKVWGSPEEIFERSTHPDLRKFLDRVLRY